MHLKASFQDQEYVYLVMELGAMSLFDHLKKQGKLKKFEVVQIMEDIIHALQYLHS